MENPTLILGSLLYGTFLTGNGMSLYMHYRFGDLAHQNDLQVSADGDQLLGKYANGLASVSITGFVFTSFFFILGGYLLNKHWQEWSLRWKMLWFGLMLTALIGLVSVSLDFTLIENFGSLVKDGEITFPKDSSGNFSLDGNYARANQGFSIVSLVTSIMTLGSLLLLYYWTNANLKTTQQREDDTLMQHESYSDHIDRLIAEQEQINTAAATTA